MKTSAKRHNLSVFFVCISCFILVSLHCAIFYHIFCKKRSHTPFYNSASCATFHPKTPCNIWFFFFIKSRASKFGNKKQTITDRFWDILRNVGTFCKITKIPQNKKAASLTPRTPVNRNMNGFSRENIMLKQKTDCYTPTGHIGNHSPQFCWKITGNFRATSHVSGNVQAG